jgi:hypothetical protein
MREGVLKELVEELIRRHVKDGVMSNVGEALSFIEDRLIPYFKSTTYMTVEEWKMRGNEAFKDKHYDDAVSFYTRAIMGTQDDGLLSVLYANRSAALKESTIIARSTDYKRQCKIDAVSSVVHNPTYAKGWHRLYTATSDSLYLQTPCLDCEEHTLIHLNCIVNDDRVNDLYTNISVCYSHTISSPITACLIVDEHTVSIVPRDDNLSPSEYTPLKTLTHRDGVAQGHQVIISLPRKACLEKDGVLSIVMKLLFHNAKSGSVNGTLRIQRQFLQID